MASLYWKWDKVIPPNICNALLESLTDLDWQESVVGVGTSAHRNLGLRNNHVHFLMTNHWLEGILYNHARYANKSANWNYEIDNISPLQLSKYKKNEFYGWHKDSYLLEPQAFNEQQRKLSVVLQLNDPFEYTDGGLELEDELSKPLDYNLLTNQGDLIVFPSFLNHRAIEVTEGTRYSATGWVTGPNFK